MFLLVRNIKQNVNRGMILILPFFTFTMILACEISLHLNKASGIV